MGYEWVAIGVVAALLLLALYQIASAISRLADAMESQALSLRLLRNTPERPEPYAYKPPSAVRIVGPDLNLAGAIAEGLARYRDRQVALRLSRRLNRDSQLIEPENL